jgi:hypothetical protein
MPFKYVIAFTVFALSSCATTNPEATKSTWDRGYLHAIKVGGNEYCGYPLIVKSTQECLQKLSATTKRTSKQYPIIVFAHGCLRVQADHSTWLASLGYIVVSPDSFARDGRYPACDGSGTIISMRIAEITYAREQLKTFDWVDQSRVYMVGVSEGGMGVAEHSGKDFRAKIVMAYGCRGGGVTGSIPVLNLVGELDDDSSAKNVLCVVRGSQSSARHVPDRGHLFLGDEFATKEIKQFLAQFE